MPGRLCDRCGGRMEFDPGESVVACAGCSEHRRAGTGASTSLGGEATCKGCGAVTAGDVATLSAPCPFCGLQMSQATGSAVDMPGSIIPFRLTESAARARLSGWLEDMPSPPRGLAEFADTARPLAGLYLPFHRISYRDEETGQGRILARSACPKLAGFIGKGDVLEDVWRKAPIRSVHSDFLLGFRVTMPTTTTIEALEAERSAMVQRYTLPAMGSLRSERNNAALEMSHLASLDRLNLEGCLCVLAPVWIAGYRWRSAHHVVVIDGWSGAVLGTRPDDGIRDVATIRSTVDWLFILAGIGMVGYLAVSAFLGSIE